MQIRWRSSCCHEIVSLFPSDETSSSHKPKGRFLRLLLEEAHTHTEKNCFYDEMIYILQRCSVQDMCAGRNLSSNKDLSFLWEIKTNVLDV